MKWLSFYLPWFSCVEENNVDVVHRMLKHAEQREYREGCLIFKYKERNFKSFGNFYAYRTILVSYCTNILQMVSAMTNSPL